MGFFLGSIPLFQKRRGLIIKPSRFSFIKNLSFFAPPKRKPLERRPPPWVSPPRVNGGGKSHFHFQKMKMGLMWF